MTKDEFPNPWEGEDQNPHENHFWAGIWLYGAIGFVLGGIAWFTIRYFMAG